MHFDEYQNLAAQTDLGNVGGRKKLKPSWMYYALGIADEQGELLGKIKKLFRDHDGDDSSLEFRKAVAHEMGDILWYMAMLAKKLKIPFDDVALLNLEKLSSRKKRNIIMGDGDHR